MAKLTRQLNTITEAGLTGSNREAKSWVFADACDVREAAAGGGTVETAGYACLLTVKTSARCPAYIIESDGISLTAHGGQLAKLVGSPAVSVALTPMFTTPMAIKTQYAIMMINTTR